MPTIPPPEQLVAPWTIRTGDRVVFNGLPGTVTRAYLGDRREHELVVDGRPGRAYAFEAELTRASEGAEKKSASGGAGCPLWPGERARWGKWIPVDRP